MLYLEEEESAFVWHGPFFLLKLKRLSAKPVGTVVTMAVLSGGADPDKAFSFRLMTGNMLRPKSWPPTWKNTACFPSHPPFVGVEILLLGPSPFPSTSIFFFFVFIFLFFFFLAFFFFNWSSSVKRQYAKISGPQIKTLLANHLMNKPTRTRLLPVSIYYVFQALPSTLFSLILVIRWEKWKLWGSKWLGFSYTAEWEVLYLKQLCIELCSKSGYLPSCQFIF